VDPEEYLILRSPGARAEPGIPGLRAAIRGAAAAELRFETAVATRGEAGALDEDPEVVAKAPVMPIVLHEPVARTPEVERDRPVAWGVQAVRASESRFT
jgi:hypothetical protein